MTYRWNTSDFAAGYDAAAGIIHPHYRAIQDEILRLLPLNETTAPLVVDLGGGSGRLMERILDQWPAAKGAVVDQSEPFLALAERRLARFGERASCVFSQLQDDWPSQLPGFTAAPTRRVTAFVSMSAIHHLEPAEKETLYRRCAELLVPRGVLLNGDEVRPTDEGEYLTVLQNWAGHMQRQMAGGNIPDAFHPALCGWIDRNVTRFGEPKKTGDDCHETIAAQLDYFRAARLNADVPWQRELWAVLRGKP
jgi:tRNA (cmo5U34)-methyltransferase